MSAIVMAQTIEWYSRSAGLHFIMESRERSEPGGRVLPPLVKGEERR